MDRFLRLNLSFLRCRTPRTLLALLWICGLLFGTLIALSAGTLLTSTMHTALHGGMSISGLLAALLLPLLVTAFAVFISQPWLLFLVAFLKAFLFSFTAFGMLMAFDSSAWLIMCMLMFSDTLLLPLLWWVWLQSFSENRSSALRSSIPAAVCATLIGCFDYAFVAPFLASLI